MTGIGAIGPAATRQPARSASPTTPVDGVEDTLTLLQGQAGLWKPLVLGLRARTTPAEAAERLERGRTVEVGERQVHDLRELHVLDTLEGSGKPRPEIAAEDALALKFLTRGQPAGVHEHRWLFGDRALGAYEAYRELKEGHEVTVQVREGLVREAKSLDEARAIFHEALSSTSIPVAEKCDPRAPLEFVQTGPQRRDTYMTVERLAYAHPWPDYAFDYYVSQPGVTVTMALQDGRAVGTCMVQRERQGPGTVSIDNLAVIPQAQGNKVGEQLLLRAVEEARRDGARSVLLEVDATNARAQRLYRKLGFEVTGQLPNYYEAAGHDGYLMELRNLQAPETAARLQHLRTDLETVLATMRAVPSRRYGVEA